MVYSYILYNSFVTGNTNEYTESGFTQYMNDVKNALIIALINHSTTLIVVSWTLVNSSNIITNSVIVRVWRAIVRNE